MQTRATQVAMSVTNILLNRVYCLSMQWVFIHSSSAFKVTKTYSSSHSQLGGVCDYCHSGFQLPKNSSTHFLTTHGLPVMRAASADLATLSAFVDADLVDVRAADRDEISGTNLQQNESAFLAFLRHTWSAGTNQRMKISRLIFNSLCKTKVSNSKIFNRTCCRRT